MIVTYMADGKSGSGTDMGLSGIYGGVGFLGSEA